ncbi:hypothetical protein CBM2634_A160155 [Cupriavidus taiwanensis]|uniref:Uncharacterized protein n=1 Tax=Cupriavidus taiwanensis TaxID=164546 RepID=A0A375IXD4_9BURK|nr:hypothetical protein CBM2634_A160155 [Cupriavidus taiwanensis]
MSPAATLIENDNVIIFGLARLI